MAKSNRTNRVRGTADSAENELDTVGTDASDLPVEEPDAGEAGLDAHDLPGADSEQDEADPVTDSGKTFPERPESAAAAEDGTASSTTDADEDEAGSVTDSETKVASPKKSSKAKTSTTKASGPAASGTTAALGRNRTAAGSESASSKKSDKSSARSGNPAKRASNRKTASYTSTPGTQTIKPNGRWFVPTMVTVLLLGLAWLVVFYVSSGAYPVGAWGYWNLGVGFAILVVGLVMSTRWR